MFAFDQTCGFVRRMRRLVLTCWLALVSTGWAAEPEAWQRISLGRAVLSLPADSTALPPAVPLWFHLHGAPDVVERNLSSLGAPGVLLNVTLPGLSQVYADFFADPTVWPRLLGEVEQALSARSGGRARAVGVITVSSFSAGFGGVRQLLRQPVALERIDALVMADSIYCGYDGDPAARRVDVRLMSGFLQFARLAAEGKKRLVISHSAQVPEGYASTTETADYLIAQLRGSRRDENETWEGGLGLRSSHRSGGFEVFGFAGSGPEDHIRHLRNLALFLERARRPGVAP